jgi:hypothetical protein
MKHAKAILFPCLIFLVSNALRAAETHPILIAPANEVDLLAQGGQDWIDLRTQCDSTLSQLIGPDYAGWGWRTALENYALAYRVALRIDATRAAKYGKKALALMKVLARHHNYGTPENSEYIGRTNGSTVSFPLPRAPLPGATVTVFLSPISITPFTYTAPTQALTDWGKIIAIGNTAVANSDFPQANWQYNYRDGLDIFILRWLNSNHPANGAQYYVALASDQGAVTVGSNQYTSSASAITFTTPPAAGQAVFVRYIGTDYEQTGNYIGGVNAVQPDGPGYQMRTFCPGLAYGYDLLHDDPDLTPALQQEFYKTLNAMLDWYGAYGYENDGSLGNYFIRGYLTGAMYTAYATADENPRGDELKTLSATLLQRTFDALNQHLPGGYGPQGQYTDGVTQDCLDIFSLWQQITGEDRLSQLEWTGNSVRAIIHGTKPDRVTFYDGGDWSDLPATPLITAMQEFVRILPNHPMSPYARQFLKDSNGSAPSGTISDYKTDFPMSYCAKESGPVYMRSDWSTSAVWVSHAAGPLLYDHQHYDQGHITIQRGGDYLLVDGGAYGLYQTIYHNTLLFDDRGAGDISTYPPGQGAWDMGDTHIYKYADGNDFVYSQSDFTRSYAAAHDGTLNSVKAAIRSLLYLRPGLVIVHDQAQSAQTGVKKIFNANFSGTLTRSGNTFSMTKGQSKLFMTAVLPTNPNPVLGTVTSDNITSITYQETLTGQLQDNFLHLFEAGATSSTATPCALLKTADGLAEGLELSTNGQNYVALFARKDRELAVLSFNYSFHGTGAQRHIITDVHPSSYYHVVSSAGAVTQFDQTLQSSTEGVLAFSFTAPATGSVLIARGEVPVVVLTSPPDGSSYVSPVNLTLTATASDADGTIAKVEFLDNGVVLNELLAPPYTLSWNNAPGGAHTLTARATDNSGNVTISAPARISISGPPNHKPVLTSGATAAPNPAVTGQMVTFSAAASDADSDPLTYAWDFGDSAVAVSSSVSHAYAAAGIYQANVAIRDGRGGSVTSSVALTVNSSSGSGPGGPGSGGPGGGGTTQPMKLGHFVASLQVAKKGRDTCSLSGTLPGLPSGFDPAGQVLVLNIGGVSATFTLNAKGMAKSPTDAFQLKLKTTRDETTKKSTFKGDDGPFKASLKKGNFADAWADEGIALGASFKNKPMTMIVTLSLGGVTYVTTANVLANISPGKTGHLKNSP